MRITKISNNIFSGKIIDSHAHVGELNGVEYKKKNLDVFVKSKLPNDDVIEKMYVSNLDVLTAKSDEYSGNSALLKELEKSSKYEIFASCSPKGGNVSNIKRLYKEYPNKFIGLKFHPTNQNLKLDDKSYIPYMDFASQNNLPCLFHSAVNVDSEGKIIKSAIDVADPSEIYTLAKKYKDTPIVMAHLGAGWNEAHDRAIDVLLESVNKGDANLYADISWVDIGLPHSGHFSKKEHRSKEHIIKAIKKLKGIGVENWTKGDQSFRLMFGSDAPIDRFADKKDRIKEYTTFVEDIKFAIRNDKDLKNESEKIIEDLFYNNAKKLYNTTSTTADEGKVKKNNLKWVIATLALILSSLFIYSLCSRPQMIKDKGIEMLF